MALIVGVDPSAAKVAMVAVETVTGTYKVGSQKLYPKGTTKQTPASLHNAMVFVRDFAQGVAHMAPEGRRFAYIEEPLVGRGGASATIKQAYVGGIIRACLVEAGFTVYDAHPSTWRATHGIKTKGTDAVKAATKQFVGAQWPKVLPEVQHDGDLVDAAAICLHGQEQVRKAGLLVAPESSGGAVQGRRPDVVVRPARVRRVVRR